MPHACIILYSMFALRRHRCTYRMQTTVFCFSKMLFRCPKSRFAKHRFGRFSKHMGHKKKYKALTKASKFPFSCRSQALCARHMQTPWFSITSDQSPECNKSFTSPVFIACLASTAPRNGQCAASLAESLCFAGNVPHTFCILCNDLPDAVSAHSCRSPQEMPCAPRDSSLPADSPAHCPRLHTCCSGQIPRECQDHRDKACNTCNRCRESWDIAS